MRNARMPCTATLAASRPSSKNTLTTGSMPCTSDSRSRASSTLQPMSWRRAAGCWRRLHAERADELLLEPAAHLGWCGLDLVSRQRDTGHVHLPEWFSASWPVPRHAPH